MKTPESTPDVPARFSAAPLLGIMDTIFTISDYETSRDYERLADVMQHQSVICITDYGKDCRDVAHTLWSPSRDGQGVWQLSARGIGYLHAFSRADFIRQCVRSNVDALMPNDPAQRAAPEDVR